MDRGILHVLPDVLPAYTAGAAAFLYIHAEHMRAPRSMLSFTMNAISIVLGGRKILQHDGVSKEVRAGSVLFYRPGHCLSTDFGDAAGPYRSLVLFFTGARLADFLSRHGVASPKGHGMGAKHVTFSTPDSLHYLAESIWRAPDGRSLSMARTHAKMDDLLLSILETQGPQVFSYFSAPAVSPPQARVRQVVEAHWREQLSWDEMAFLCHMSLSTFKRHFQAVHGCAPGRWLLTRQLELAAHWLKAEGRRPCDVYADAGFSTPSSFTQAFKGHFGVTPKAYQDASS